MNRARYVSYLSMLIAMAISLNMFESMYIGAFSFGIRIGLANIIALLALKLMGVKEMIIVNVMRVVVSTFLRGFGVAFFISFGGVLLSSVFLIVLDRLKASILFTSIVSSLAHSTGQVLVVMFFYKQVLIATILPYLFLGSIPTGVLTGLIASMVLKRIRPVIVKGL